MLRRWFSALTLLLFASVANAELPAPRIDRLAPLGASAGSSVEVEVQGADLEEASLRFEHPGITATPIEGKERWFKVTIAGDVPAGTYDLRVVGRWGVSNPRIFAVTIGLVDIEEKEPNNEPAQAQRIELDSAVNANSDGNNFDVFRFTLAANKRVVIDCQAGKLESPLDATMSVAAADGKILASSSDHNGRDPRIDFIAPADGEYLVQVSDLSFRGNYPYRLVLSDKPHAEVIFPPAVQAGQTAQLTALGQNLGSGSTPSSWRLDDKPLEELKFSFTPDADILATKSFTFFEHPTDHSVIPTAATCTLTGSQARLAAGDAFGTQPLVVTDHPVAIEAEPNDSADKPQPISLPAVVAGRFDQPRDADWFEVSSPEGGKFAVEVFCERIRGNADAYLVILDDKNNRIMETDDFGHRMQAFDGHLRDPVTTVDFDKGRKYRILVQDRYRRGGVRYQYVLAVTPVRPDFYPAVIHSSNPNPAGTTIWRGGTAFLDVIVHQTEGFNGEITFTAENLPPGVHALPTVLNNNNRGTFVLWADDNAADFTGPIKLWATGKRGEETIKREVRAYTRVAQNDQAGSVPSRDLVIAVRDGAPYRLEWASDRIEATAGNPVEAKLKLVRRWEDFKNDVTVQNLAFPGNFSMNNTSFTGGTAEIAIPINVQANTKPGEFTLALQGQGQVPFQKDAKANKANTLVSLPSRPLTIVVKAAEK
jgi:hypothetical protein